MDLSDLADALTPQDPSSASGSSPLSHLNKFVDKTTHAINGLQGHPPAGGHPVAAVSEPDPKFAHLHHLPMFSLEQGEDGARVMQKRLDRMEEHQSRIVRLGGGDKAALTALSIATGGHLSAGIHMENSVRKLNIASGKFTTTASSTVAVTRWALPAVAPGPGAAGPAAGGTLLVDVFELRPSKSWMGQRIIVMANRAVELKVRGKWEATLKAAGKSWSKTTTTSASVDEMAILLEAEDGKGKGKGKKEKAPPVEIPMGMVMRLERLIPPAEYSVLQKRFEKTWSVPAVA